MVFAQKLEALCRRRGLSRSDLVGLASAVVGCSVCRSTVNNWFRGRSRPSLPVGLCLARALVVPLEYLADDDLDGPPPGADDATDERAALLLYRRARDQIGAAEALAALAALTSGCAAGGVPPGAVQAAPGGVPQRLAV